MDRISRSSPVVAKSLVGIAGVHFVACELSRRGLIALPTTRNTAKYDLIALNPQNGKASFIQVKTKRNPKSKGWLMPKPSEICVGPRDFHVFVRGVEVGAELEAFMVPGRIVKTLLKDSSGNFNHVRLDTKAQNKWRVRWERFLK